MNKEQSEAEVEALKRRGIRRAVGRRALQEIGRLVAEHEREERARRRLVRRLWLPLVALAAVAAVAFVAWRLLAPLQ